MIKVHPIQGEAIKLLVHKVHPTRHQTFKVAKLKIHLLDIKPLNRHVQNSSSLKVYPTRYQTSKLSSSQQIC